MIVVLENLTLVVVIVIVELILVIA